MIGQFFTYNEKSLPYTREEGREEGWYPSVQVMNIATDYDTDPRQGMHGVYCSPVFARERVIEVRGKIWGKTKEERGIRRKKLEEIFTLPSLPTRSNGYYPLAFTDDDGTQWEIQAKVITLPSYDHDLSAFVIDFSLELLAQNPVMYSKEEYSFSGNYGRMAGSPLNFTLPQSLSEYSGKVEAINEGSFSSPCRIEISGSITNPKILNITTGQSWKINRQITPDDHVVIDGFSQTLTINEIDSISLRAEGSKWVQMTPGVNYFVLTGDDYDADDTQKASFTVFYKYARL